MNHAEIVAKHVLEHVLHGSMEFQSEQSHGECDFELRYENGVTAAVEVTAAVDETEVQTLAAIHDKKKGGSSIPAIKCKKSWAVAPTKSARINKIRAEADEYLSRLEQSGIDEFSWVRHWDQPGVQEICRDLAIKSASVIATETVPEIYIMSPVSGGAVGPSKAIEAGEKEAWKQDNRKKLGAAKTPEHHLVVYIDAMNGLPWVALTDFEPPSALPNLPQEITCLWLVGHAEEANQLVVWFAGTKEPWVNLHVEYSPNMFA